MHHFVKISYLNLSCNGVTALCTSHLISLLPIRAGEIMNLCRGFNSVMSLGARNLTEV